MIPKVALRISLWPRLSQGDPATPREGMTARLLPVESEPHCFPSHSHPLPRPDSGLEAMWLARGNDQFHFFRNQDSNLPLLFPNFFSQGHQISLTHCLPNPLSADGASRPSGTRPSGIEVFCSLPQQMGKATLMRFQGTHLFPSLHL